MAWRSGKLIPLRQRLLVPVEAALAAFAGAPRVAFRRFRKDLDALVEQDSTRVPDQRHPRGLIDTSVIIDLDRIDEY